MSDTLQSCASKFLSETRLTRFSLEERVFLFPHIHLAMRKKLLYLQIRIHLRQVCAYRLDDSIESLSSNLHPSGCFLVFHSDIHFTVDIINACKYQSRII